MKDMTEFWNLVVDVWQHGVIGIDVGRMAAALGIFLVFLMLRGLLTRFLMGWLRMMTKRTPWTLDDQILAAIEPPVRFVPVVMGLFFAFQVLKLAGTPDQMASNLVRSLIAFTIFWALYRAVDPLSVLLHRLDRIFSTELVEWMARAIRVLVFIIGAAAVLEIWGIKVGPIIAGFGLIGVAVALGAQDLFKNLIAGLLILAEKRFHKGDWIHVEGVVEGHVETIGFRSTMVRRFDKAPVMVPNSQLSDTAVINFTAMTHRRIKWLIGVEYRTSVDQLRVIRDQIAAYLEETPEFAPATDVSTFVRIDSFGDSSINIMVYCFTITTKWGEYLEIKEHLAYKVMDIVHGAGAAFAFPSQSIYVESLPGDDAPEIFQPPPAPPVE
ncbi:MAG TPA: mechanosensitive ion channel protein MscS [Rhodospirillaceae bacterium]|nr:mechanosensitive ion channel protein MscS [Rhodospirillaceae bacterium]